MTTAQADRVSELARQLRANVREHQRGDISIDEYTSRAGKLWERAIREGLQDSVTAALGW